MPRPILSSTQARHLLAQYNASPLTQAAFCRKHAISSSLFTYWQSKLLAPVSSAARPSFRELPLTALPPAPGPCTLSLPSGARVEFPATHLATALAALLGGKAPC